MCNRQHHGGAGIVVHLHDRCIHIVRQLAFQVIQLLLKVVVCLIHIRAVFIFQHDHGPSVAG